MIYGIDVGGTKIETAIFDYKFVKQTSWRVNTPTHDYAEFLDTLIKQINKADDYIKGVGIIGIGIPGLIDKNGKSLSANIPCANGKSIKSDLTAILGREVVIENDCRCFALSEANGGAGVDFKRVYGAIIGTGAAGGLCIDAKIDTGANGIVGEYGHIPLPAFFLEKYGLPSVNCGCGLSGCMEYYVSGPGLGRLHAHFFAEDKTSIDIFSLASSEDEKSLKTISCYLDLLGYTFASIVLNHDPDIIVVGGGISKVDIVITMLPDSVKPFLFKGVDAPRIVRAKYGDASGGRGAAILAKQAFS